MTPLLEVAQDRFASSPVPPQRYGLGVFLRKPYPRLEPGPAGPGRDVTRSVRGAGFETARWDDLPREVLELVRERVAEDALVASHVLRAAGVLVVRAGGEKALAFENLLARGAVTTLLIDVQPRAKLVIWEGNAAGGSGGEDPPTRSGAPRGDPEEVASALILLRVGAGAHVRWLGDTVGMPWCTLVERMGFLSEDATLEYSSALVGLDHVRENTHIVLAAPGAGVRTRGLFAGAHDHQFDIGITAEHRAPRTMSDLRVRGVLGGAAQAVVRGLVRVERGASGADGYQRCDTVLLSPTAEVDPVPTLEINTNDVRCTHGVTTGHLNPEHLFYLQSRGLDERAARDLLVAGFVGSILQDYPEQDREKLESAVRGVVVSDT